MPTIGLADIQVVPSFKGFQQSVGREVDGAAGQVGRRAGSTMGGALGKALKVGAIGVAGAAVTGLGVALTKGFARLQNIENARAKLTGLGHSAKSVETIMQNALGAVKGTAFGLDEAATVAANAVAAGVKPGKALERTLKLVGDAATIAGTDMGSMGAIFNKAAASNKVQMDIINQLHDAGVPALSLLAKQMGVTSEEASKMASKGEVDFATFQAAMEKGLGGAAQESGKTLQGAFKNTMAAVGRIGANLLTGVYPKIQQFFSGAIGWLEPLEAGAKIAGAAIGTFLEKAISGAQGVYDVLVKGDYTTKFREAFGVEEDHPFVGFLFGVRDAFIGLSDYVQNTALPALRSFGDFLVRQKDTLISVAVAVGVTATAYKAYTLAVGLASVAQTAWAAATSLNTGGFFKTIFQGTLWFIGLARAQGLAAAAQWALNAAMVANPIGIIIAAVAGLVAGLVWFFTQTETGRKVIETVWGAIQSAIGAVVDWFTGTVAPFFTQVWEGILDLMGTVGDFFGVVGEKIGGVWAGIVGAVSTAWGVISGIFTSIVGAVSNFLAPVFDWLWQFLKPIWVGISGLVKIAWAIIETAFLAMVWVVTKVLAPMFQSFWKNTIQPAWNGIAMAIKIAWSLIGPIFDLMVKVIKTVVAVAFTWFYNTVIKPVWDGIKWYIGNVWLGIQVIFNAIKWAIDHVLAPVFQWLYKTIIKPVWDAIGNLIRVVWEKKIKPIFEALGNFIENKVVPAFQKGVEGIKGIWESIMEIARKPINFIIGTVYNDGLRQALNKVRSIVGGDPLPELPLVGAPSGNKGMATTGGRMRQFAKGGFAAPGWALVGEEGPELVNFSSPGRVYTAAQSRKMLATDVDKRSNLPMGAGLWDGIKSAASSALSWVRGGLANAAGLILNPIKDGIAGTLSSMFGKTVLGDVSSGLVRSTIDNALSWIRGNDAADAAAGLATYDGPRGLFTRPSRGPFTSMFGYRPAFGDFHTGVDIGGGGPTYAALNGVVSRIGYDPIGGNWIRLNHGGGFGTYYGHNPANGIIVKQGQKVKAGQRIGTQGMTGLATGVHLHFQAEQNGKPVNPMAYLHDQGGVLRPGLSTILNNTRKPEAILNAQQWSDIHTLASRNTGGAGTQVTIKGNVGWMPDELVQQMDKQARRAQTVAGMNGVVFA